MEFDTSNSNLEDDSNLDNDTWDEALAKVNLDLNPEPVLLSSTYFYQYENVRIEFPYEAYQSQQQMMRKIIQGVKSGNNCLLESPTGTGKTAALLCSLLAWQQDCYRRKDNCISIIRAQAQKYVQCSCGLVQDKETSRVTVFKQKDKIIFQSVTPVPVLPSNDEESWPDERVETITKKVEEPDLCKYCVKMYAVDTTRPPRIYYCTRTHSQIAQVIKQLKATAYKTVPMTILSSRGASCINDEVLAPPSGAAGAYRASIQELCSAKMKNGERARKLREKLGESPDIENALAMLNYCKHHKSVPESFSAYKKLQAKGAFDIEDSKRFGMEQESCPFLGCDKLQPESDIVFGAYNYLLHPAIRTGKNIRYQNSVLVFDEAHNIEDLCRNVFSFKIELGTFDPTMREIVDSLLVKANETTSCVKPKTKFILEGASSTFKIWSDKIKEKGGNEVKKTYKGRMNDRKGMDVKIEYSDDSLVEILADLKMTEAHLKSILRPMAEDEEEAEGDSEAEEESEYYRDSNGRKHPFKIPVTVMELLKDIEQTIKHMGITSEDEGFGGVKDFKGFIIAEANPNRKSLLDPEFVFIFELICLNPAIGIKQLRDHAFSIIVASGTLTPINSFASELATDFAITLQADHVIPRGNVFAAVITTGPSSKSLRLVKDQQDDPDIQDDIGKVLVRLCYTVPNGILVFFPSYSLMRKLQERWNIAPGRGASIMSQMTSKKYLFTEESKDKNVFKSNMERYKELVKGHGNMTGCILFAVFRGKISEGIDFADEQARAVVTIGIPYSNLGAPDISAKREYNDMRMKRAKKGEQFLSGSQWYTTQAFRAMNQGFGRCVRHRDDWGALLLIESRVAHGANDRYLSGWVKVNLDSYEDLNTVESKLKVFLEKMKNKKFSEKTDCGVIGIKRKRQHVTVEYEIPDIEVSEANMFDDCSDEIMTQLVTEAELATQVVPSSPPPPRTSSPINEAVLNLSDDVVKVGESSSEHSFSSDLFEPGEYNAGKDKDCGENDSYGSVMEKTSSESGHEVEVKETRINRCSTELRGTLYKKENENGRVVDNSLSDVSMPSADAFSQMSGVSYNSE